jgi:hypothetical protein
VLALFPGRKDEGSSASAGPGYSSSASSEPGYSSSASARSDYGRSASARSDFTPYFTLYTNHRISPDCASLDQWYVVGSGVRGEPAVVYNHTDKSVSCLTIVQPPDMLNLHPGPSGEKSVVRWTAPTAGTVKIEGRFEGIDKAGTTTDVAVVKNTATTLFSDNIDDYGDRAPFSITTTVAAGDTIDFAVGYGSNADYTSDSTGLSVTITPTGSGDSARNSQSAVDDFSATENPNGAWSYVYLPSAGSDYNSSASARPGYSSSASAR